VLRRRPEDHRSRCRVLVEEQVNDGAGGAETACRSGGAEMVTADELVQLPQVDRAGVGAWQAQAVEQLSRGSQVTGSPVMCCRARKAAADARSPLAWRGVRMAGSRDCVGCPRLPGPGSNGPDTARLPLIFWKSMRLAAWA
jgi:hypothetical protein